jgi:hypothetical protein
LNLPPLRIFWGRWTTRRLRTIQSESSAAFEKLTLPTNWEKKTNPCFRSGRPGTDVMIFKIFSPKILAKIFAFFDQTAETFCINLFDHNNGF